MTELEELLIRSQTTITLLIKM